MQPAKSVSDSLREVLTGSGLAIPNSASNAFVS
jgi:hypothetical protein